MVHAIVNRTLHTDSTRYAIDLEDSDLKTLYGRIILDKSAEGRWKVVNSLNSIEDIFVQLTAAIDNAELTLTPNEG